jgi:hypothetical protein
LIIVNSNQYLDVMTFIIDHTFKVTMKIVDVYYDLINLIVLLDITANEEVGHINSLEVEVV